MAAAPKAPEFADSLRWLNTNTPPKITGSLGKVVLIYFWTPSNVNSINLLPDIRALENKFENGLVVVGVLCPKFPRESDPAGALKAVNRLFIRHPVALDPDFALWRKFGVTAWPTVAIIDAEGHLRRILRGDDRGDELDATVTFLLDEAAGKEIRNYGQNPRVLREENSGPLQFPCALLIARDHIYISDSGNNRILEVKEDGRITRVFGSGNPGFWDGTLQNGGFNSPRGLAISENYLYVADTGNHAIRRVNLYSGDIETVAGVGKPRKTVVVATPNVRRTPLVSPVGLAVHGPSLFITVTGLNQIWRLDLKNNRIGWFSGSGRHGLVNGAAAKAAFASPMGMAVGEHQLFVADADSSSVREVQIQTGAVSTRSGRGTFTFGCEDGVRKQALMQYPMDVALNVNKQQLWIADSYNNRLRLMDVKSGRITSPVLHHQFNEPNCIVSHGRVLWIADTNSHDIVRVHMADRACEPFKIIQAAV